MRRILYISNYYGGVGGIDTQVDLLRSLVKNERIRELESEGYTSIEDRRLKIEDCRYETKIFSTKGNPFKRIILFFKLLFVARRYDVLHIHGCSDWGMVPVVYGVIAGRIWRKKVLITYHGGEAAEYFKKHGAFARRWLRRADTVIVLNGYLEKVFNGYDIPCVVIPNVVKLPEVKHEYELNPRAPKFISVRNLREVYNIPCILRAFERMQQELPDASLTILGDGDKRAELEEWVKRKVESGKLKEGSVTFVGQVPNKEMNAYLAEHDVFLSAPRVDNMPVSVLEAMNAGVLVISSNVGGVPYLIEHERTGLLFDLLENKNTKNKDQNNENILLDNQKNYKENTKNNFSDSAEALAEQMEWALQHQEECLQIIANAKREVNKYSWENVRKQLLPLYEV